jgi:hypothetical protein
MPTYFGNVIQWNAGSIIPVPHPDGLFNITLVKSGNAEGPGNITGSVNSGSGLTTSSTEYRSGHPMKDALLLLFDSDENPIGHASTNDKGEFYFRNIAFGTYKVLVERVGYEDEWNWVTLNSTTPQVSNLNFNVPEASLTPVEDKTTAVQKLNVYPNPATEQLNLQMEVSVPQETTIRMFNLTGKTVYSEKIQLNSGTQNHSIDISKVVPGLYFIQLTSGQKTVTSKVVKE